MIPTKRDHVLEEAVDVFCNRLPADVQAFLSRTQPRVRYAREVPQAQVLPDMNALLSEPDHPYVPGQMFGPTQTEEPERRPGEPQVLLEG